MKSIQQALERTDAPGGFARYARRFSSFGEFWNHCNRADWMLWVVENYYPGHYRRLRLFVTKCARRWWHFLPDVRSQRAVAAAERYVSGEVSREALLFMRQGAEKAAEEATTGKPILSRAARIALLTLEDNCLASSKETLRLFCAAGHGANETNSCEQEEAVLSELADYLREVLGNPFETHGARSAAA